MTQEINKYSVLMAEFMGVKVYPCAIEKTNMIKGYYFSESEEYIDWTKYHENYQHLMPVWVKFRDPDIDHTHNKQYKTHITSIKNSLVGDTIEEAFMKLGIAIEWYNTIKEQ